MKAYGWIVTAALALAVTLLAATVAVGYVLFQIIAGAFALLAILTTEGIYP